MRLVALALLSVSCSLVLDFDDGEPSLDAAVDASSDASDVGVDGDVRDASEDAPMSDAADVGVLDARSDVGERDAAEDDGGVSCATACGAPPCRPEDLTYDGTAVEMSYMVSLSSVRICHRDCSTDDVVCSDATPVGDPSAMDFRWAVSVTVDECTEFELHDEGGAVNNCSFELGE